MPNFKWIIPGLLLVILLAGCLDAPTRLDTNDSHSGAAGDYWLSAMTINTEWLWDYDNNIDGEVLGPDDIPSFNEYWAEIRYFAGLILENNANLVAVQEIEGCHIIEDIRHELGTESWHTVCQEGRDTYTGQDVAIVTQFPVVFGPDTFPDTYGQHGGSSVRPSKIVGAVLETPHGDMAVITTHLLSKANPDNDVRRVAQADAVLSNFHALMQRPNVAHGLVLGDLNDTPNSTPLVLLTSSGTLRNTLYANGRAATSSDCSFTFQGNCELIDHILKTNSLNGGEFRVVNTNRQYTDHQAVLYRLESTSQ